jgi:hypothetical protein
MGLLAGELAEIVWAETKAFGPAPGDGTGNLNGVRRLVALLAASTGGVGFDKREPLLSVDDRRYGDTARAIMLIAENAKAVAGPQNRLIIWEANDDPSRLNTKTDPPAPEPWDKLAPNRITNHLHQQLLPNGRTVDVFSRAPLSGAEDGAVFVNALTGTGVPGGRAPMAEAKPATAARPKLGFWMFVVATVLFALAAACSYGVGVGSRLTLGQFVQNARIAAGGDQPALDCGVTTSDRPTVLNTANWRSNPDPSKDCRSQYTAAQSRVAAAQYPDPQDAAKSTPPEAGKPAPRNAGQLRKTTWPEWFASVAFSWSSAGGSSVSLVIPLAVALISFVLLFVAAGYGVAGRPLGPIIDDRNRMSLTLAQLVMWSIILLSGLLVIGLYNYGFGGLVIAELEQQAAAATAAGETPNTAKLALDAYHLFPSIPYYLYYLAGFAVATPFISRLISNTTLVGTPEQTAPDRTATAAAPKYLHSNDSPAQAAMADMVTQEVKGRSDLVDTSRVQHVAITGILGISYLLVLFDAVSSIDAVRIVYAATQNASVLAAMPQIDGTFTALLFVSHAALIGSKVYDKMVPGVTAGKP